MSKINIVSDGYTLAGNLFAASKPQNLAFLFIQGWTGHQNIKAAMTLADLGYSALTYDMRGNGDSEGDIAKFSRADFLADAVAVYDYLKKSLPKGTKIGVIGSSFGSYTGSLLTKLRDICCLSLRVPANYPDEGFDGEQLEQKIYSNDFKEWRKQALSHTENLALAAIHNFAGPVQIIEAGADELVSHQTVQNYIDAVTEKTKLTLVVMHNAPHGLATKDLQAEYETILTSWVTKL